MKIREESDESDKEISGWYHRKAGMSLNAVLTFETGVHAHPFPGKIRVWRELIIERHLSLLNAVDIIEVMGP